MAKDTADRRGLPGMAALSTGSRRAQTPLDLAARVHDGPLQLLAVAQQELAEPDIDVDRVRDLVTDAMHELRSLQVALPAEIAVGEARRLLSWWSSVVLRDTTAHIDLRLPPEGTSMSFMACEIARELLTNAVRHARAQQIAVSIHRDRGAETIEVEDDGVGMHRTWKPGYGLSAMYARVQAAGGSTDHRPSHPTGTTATVRLPARMPAPPIVRLTARRQQDGPATRVIYAGDLELTTLDLIPVAPEGEGDLCLDLAAVTYLDSAGLHHLDGVASAAIERGASVRFVIGTEPVMRAFDAVGFLERYDVNIAPAM